MSRSTALLLVLEQQLASSVSDIPTSGCQQLMMLPPTHQEPALQPFAPCPQTAQPCASHTQARQPNLACLLRQLDALGWHRVGQLAPDLGQLTLQLQDAAGRTHLARLQLPPSFPTAGPAVAMQLPGALKPRWRPGDTLASLAAQLEQVLDSFQPLWQQLEDLDTHTQLLDPPSALARPYAHCSRCLALGNGASCQLQLAPGAPAALPSSVVFHGPSSVVAGLQSSWYGAAHRMWQEQASVRDNLEAVLQLRLPPPKPGVRKGCAAAAAGAAGAAVITPDGLQLPPLGAAGRGLGAAGGGCGSDVSGMEEEDEDTEEDSLAPGACAICYALHLADPARPDQLGAAPGVTCPAALCGRAFHAACLAEWLGALPTSRRVFDTLFGSCPFCQGPIGVSTKAGAA